MLKIKCTMKQIVVLTLIASVVAGGAFAKGADQRTPSRKNAVLIIADDMGLDMGTYGNTHIKTPNLDKLAERGTLFTNAFATVSSCSPSRSVLLSGLYSHTNGVYGLAHGVHNQHFLPDVKTLPTLLKGDNVTVGLVGKKHLLPSDQLSFDIELEPERPGQRAPERLAQGVQKFINRAQGKSFFLVVGFSDPHRDKDGFGTSGGEEPPLHRLDDVEIPQHLPDILEVRRDLAEYYRAVERLDKGVGLIVDTLAKTGQDKDTLIIFLSDNGRPFPGAKTTLYDEGIHLPLIVVSPNSAAKGIKNDAMVSWIDIAPTVLDWFSDKSKVELPGKSLLAIIGDEHDVDRNTVFASHSLHEIDQYFPMRAVRTRRFLYISNLSYQLPYPVSGDVQQSKSWKSIVSNGSNLGHRKMDDFLHRPAEELYDLIQDPEQINNIASDPAYEKDLKTMREQLREFREKTNDPWLPHTDF